MTARICFALLITFPLAADFIEFEEFASFQEYMPLEMPSEELALVDEQEEPPSEFFHEEIIAEQKDRESLIALAHAFSESDYQLVKGDEGYFFIPPNETLQYPSHLYPLLQGYLRGGGTVVDYGAGNGIWTVALADLVGRDGKVVAFESHPKNFIEMFWNLVLNHIQNAELYCTSLDSKEMNLDALELDDVSLIRINADGKEDSFLKGATATIRKNRPILIVKILGGIPKDWADRFVLDEYARRLKQIETMGYTTQQINSGEYLALPLTPS